MMILICNVYHTLDVIKYIHHEKLLGYGGVHRSEHYTSYVLWDTYIRNAVFVYISASVM